MRHPLFFFNDLNMLNFLLRKTGFDEFQEVIQTMANHTTSNTWIINETSLAASCGNRLLQAKCYYQIRQSQSYDIFRATIRLQLSK